MTNTNTSIKAKVTLSNEQREELYQLHLNGVSDEQLMAQFDVSKITIKRIIDKKQNSVTEGSENMEMLTSNDQLVVNETIELTDIEQQVQDKVAEVKTKAKKAIKEKIEKPIPESNPEMLAQAHEISLIEQQIAAQKLLIEQLTSEHNEKLNQLVSECDNQPKYLGNENGNHYKLVQRTEPRYNKDEKKQVATRVFKVITETKL